MANQLQERASIETLYDSIKWIVFGVFAVVYFGIKENHFWWGISFLIIFVVILYLINLRREKQLDKFR